MSREVATRTARKVDVTVGIPTRNRSGLLAKAMESVLRQTYRDFTLVVSDNASDDDTADVVASFGDPRVVYRPLDHDIGRPANTNRLIELADTEFLVLLGDDDALLPDHLSLTVEALKRSPSAGLVQTGCAVVDLRGNTLISHDRMMKSKRAMVFESGARYLERCMTPRWTTNFSSTMFRRAALVRAGGLRPEDGSIDDLPLMMRIAAEWDFAYVNCPLAVKTVHDEASSSVNGSYTDGGWQPSSDLPDLLYEHRRAFLAQSSLPERQARHLGRIARMTHLSMRGWLGEDSGLLFRELRAELRGDPGLALEPRMWRFVAAQLGGRRARDGARRALEPA
jgi:hypothetical protein